MLIRRMEVVMSNGKQWRVCDACGKEFEIGNDYVYQRVCDGCEAAADDYAQQRYELERECAEARFIDVEPR